MPIYEFACPKCRKIFSFLSKRINPDKSPKCPKCGNKKLVKEISNFAMIKGAAEPQATGAEGPDDMAGMPDMEGPKMERFMREMESDMSHMDENNPKHMAHMMNKMKEIMPADALPKEFDIAIKRLAAGEDPEKIEEDMGDVLGDAMGGMDDEDGMGGMSGMGGAPYSRDGGLYDY